MDNPESIDPEILHGCTLIDVRKESIGPVHRVWVADDDVTLRYFGVNTAVVVHRVHAIPALGARIDLEHRAIYVPYRVEQIAEGPRVADEPRLSAEDEQKVQAYFAGIVPGTALESETLT